MITELWSCGQTGVAQGALRAAKHCKLRTGGWMAQGFHTEAGPAPEIAKLYQLKEFSRSGELQPIRRNVKECDASLWIAAPLRTATDRAYWATRKAVATYGHPFFLIPSKLNAEEAGQQIAEWAARWEVIHLHVSGPRASLWPGGEERARLVVTEALHSLGLCRLQKLALVS